LRLSDFDFVCRRSGSRSIPRSRATRRGCCMSIRTGWPIAHVRDLPSLLHPGDVLVVNDTRVIPAQLQARRGDARIGITLDRPQRGRGTWRALARNARRLRVGDR
jgi:S-adenosylmethionine:tRNA-ribosyltransferase-isomerase (queuine synthetase)